MVDKISALNPREQVSPDPCSHDVLDRDAWSTEVFRASVFGDSGRGQACARVLRLVATSSPGS